MAKRIFVALVFAVGLAACGQDCPHTCYCCDSVSSNSGGASCADTSYLMLKPSSVGLVCTSCKSACASKAPGTTAIACNGYGSTGEIAGCTVDD